MSPLDPVKIPEEGEDACSFSSAPEATRTASPSTGPSPHTTPLKMKKSVSFSTLQIREFNITLGDNPSTASGPPVTLEWQPQRTFSVELDKYEQGLTGPRRSSVELRMPAAVRQKMLKQEHSPRELQRAERDAQRIQHQRQYSYATQEMEELEIFFQSVVRKYRRWRKNRSGKPVDPAEVWVQEHKRQEKQRRKMMKDELRRRGSCPAKTSSSGKAIIPLDDDDDDDDDYAAPASEPILSCTNLLISKQESSTEASTVSNNSQETKEEEEGESSIESAESAPRTSISAKEQVKEDVGESSGTSSGTAIGTKIQVNLLGGPAEKTPSYPLSPTTGTSTISVPTVCEDNEKTHVAVTDEPWGHEFDEIREASIKMRFL